MKIKICRNIFYFIANLSLPAYLLIGLIWLSPGYSMAYKPKEGFLHGSIGPYFHRTNFGKYDDTATSPWSLGLNLNVEGALSKRSALEVGLFFIDKTYIRKAPPWSTSKLLIQKAKRTYITTGYRYWWKAYFSTALNFFSSYSMGDPKDLEGTSTDLDLYPTSAEDPAEYGFDFSFRYERQVATDRHLFADLRYSLGLTPQKDESTDHFAFLFSYGWLIK